MKNILVVVAMITTLINSGAYPDQLKTVSTESALFGMDAHGNSTKDKVLDGYIHTALENNQGLRASFDAWQAAMEVIPQAKALPDPTFQWTHFIEEIQTRTGPQDNKFVLSQTIPWNSKRTKAGLIAQDQAEHLWWKAMEYKLEVIRQVKHVYAEYAYLAQNKRIVEENLTLLRNLEPVVQVRIRSGASQGDLLRLQVEIGKEENELRSLKSLRPALERQLRAVTNQPQGDPIPWPTPLASNERIYQTGDLMQQLEANNPALKQLNWMIVQADHLGSLRNLQRKPDFTVGLTYIDTGEASGAMKPSDSGDDPFGVTIGVSIPIWSKKYDAGVREAQHKESSFRYQQKQKKLNLHAQLEMEAYRVQDAAHNISLYRDTLIPRARQAMEVIQVSYQSGNNTLLDIIDSERDLLLFEQSYWRAQRDYAQGLAALEALCGGELS